MTLFYSIYACEGHSEVSEVYYVVCEVLLNVRFSIQSVDKPLKVVVLV